MNEPKLIIADEARACRIAARCTEQDVVSLPVDWEIEEAIAELLAGADGVTALPEVAPEDDANIPAAKTRELAAAYGDRFAATDRLVEMAEKGESFPA